MLLLILEKEVVRQYFCPGEIWKITLYQMSDNENASKNIYRKLLLIKKMCFSCWVGLFFHLIPKCKTQPQIQARVT